VVRFDVERTLNLGDIEYVDLLVMLGLRVYQKARASGLHLDEGKLNDLRFWYKTHVLEEDERRKLDSEVAGEVNAVLAKFSVKVATEAPKREQVRSEARSNLSDLLERLDALLLELRQKSGRRTIVLVDGLDKIYDLNQLQDLFGRGARALQAPRCRIVYTVPLALYHTNDFGQVRMSFTRNFCLANVKTREQDGAPVAEGQQSLRNVLDCRLVPGLVAPQAAERLVELCGGLLKELIALARQAVLHARQRRDESGPVQVEDVEYAARQVRNTFRALLTEAQYAELGAIYRGRRFVNSAVARELMHNLSLLEYNGGDAWWGIHPIVRPLLEERETEQRAGGGSARGSARG
jgi:hypothetical protein